MIWLLVLGCPQDAPSPHLGALVDDLGAVERYEVDPAIGVATVRAVNALGTPVAAAPVRATVGGVESELAFDGHGYAEVHEDVGIGDVSAVVHPLDPLPDLGLLPALPGWPVSRVAAGTGGAFVADDTTAWWVGFDGTSHRLLALDTLGGLVSGHLDLDGVLDLVAWDGTTFYVLRGRSGGGASLGAALRADGRAPGAAAVGDLDGNGTPDLVVAWNEPSRGDVEVWEAASPWDLAPAGSVPVGEPVTGLAVGDATLKTHPQVTATLLGGRWARVARFGEDGYTRTGPEIDLSVQEAATVGTEGDFNGDGAEEVFVFGPRLDGAGREVQVYDLVGAELRYQRVTPVGAHVDLEDAQADGLVDLWYLDESGALGTLSWTGEQSSQRVVLHAAHAPFAARDQTGDGVPELLVAAPDWFAWHLGATELVEGDAWWAPAPADEVRAEAGLTGPLVRVEVDGEAATVEVAAFAEDGAATWLRTFSAGPDGLALHSSLALSAAGAAPLDLAACGDGVVALTTDGLTRVDWTAGVPAPTASVGITADRVDCGGDRVATLAGDSVTVRAPATLAALSTVAIPGAEDVALTGGGEVETCATASCRVVVWPSPVGEVVAIADAQGLDVEGASGPGGELSVHDADGDGAVDLLVADGAAVSIWRTLLGEHRRLGAPAAGNVVAADAGGDGSPDLLHLDAAGDLVLTRASP